jgi:quinohemoprotein amine dehydrogenase
VKPAGAAEALAFLSKAAPLHTPEWDAWAAHTATPLTGRWLVTASMPGRGQFHGEAQVDRTGEDEFATRITLTSVKDGSRVVRKGKSAVYGGTDWRGRSTGESQGESAPDDPSSEAREVVWIAADHLSGEGRWFWGQYQEFGFDVKLRRPPTGAAVSTPLLVDRSSFKAGSQSQRIRLIGENFPARVSPVDLAMGSGVTVRRIVSSNPGEIVAELDVAANAEPGKRDVVLRGGASPLRGAIAVYDRIDYMKVTPESAMAAFGDRAHPRGFQQFEAIGYQRGPDGRAHTDDDLELGPVDATWALEVFHAALGSSSDYVGKMSSTGLLTPSSTNPNVNYDTWVIATARDEKNPIGEPLVGKAYVVVTIPTYAFNGRQYIRDLNRWVDDGPAVAGRGVNGRPPR